MPTESKKKKSKHDEKKSLLSIKSEPEDLKPLEHYVDDRIELIKQIFDSLKTKTVESIIPEFLQEKSLEEIQEICLEEVLGISKKRLLSIINATKCPTDTESSDSGSDVEKVEEHISLEEISSDSNDELSKPRKKKKRELKKETKPGPATEKPAEQNGKGEKQYSVLELLELQARARAIRSQLALEPVTKIELDDSDDNEPENKNESKEKEKQKEKQKDKGKEVRAEPASNVSQSSSSGRQHERESSKVPEEEPKVPPSRPVRLKRNFRQRQMEGYESDESRSVTEKESGDKTQTEQLEKQSDKPQTPEKPVEKEKSPEKEKTPEKVAEPTVPNDDDVVPIIAEPEILCISSSSDSETDEKKEKEKNKTKKRYITMPVIEKEVRPPTEDELFLQKIKKKSEAQQRAERNSIKTSETSAEAQNKEISEKIARNKSTETKNSESENADIEMEDGEIVEEEEIFEIPESPEPQHKKKADEGEKEKEKPNNEKESESQITSVPETDKSRDDSRASGSESDSDKDGDGSSSESESDNSEKTARSQTSKKSNVADDDDEDIIDLGKDEDLDFEQLEMNTSNDKVNKEEETSTRRTRSKAKTAERESPTDLEPKDESWDKRWLRGNKVSKVLATSRLANKVRSKIKEKKTKTKIAQKPEEPEPPKETIPEAPLNVEVGSVEHYKELTKQK